MEKILVPNDGSAESERALAIAVRVAQAQNAEILLVRVVEPITAGLAAAGDVSPDMYEEFTEAIEQESASALAAVAEKVGPGVRVRTQLLRGPVEGALLDYETTEKPDLVVIATHGRTGLARFAL